MPILTLILALDGVLSRAEGVLLLTLFAVWLTLAARQAIAHRRGYKEKAAAAAQPTAQPLLAALFLIAGLASLILSGRLFVTGASGIAVVLGVHLHTQCGNGVYMPVWTDLFDPELPEEHGPVWTSSDVWVFTADLPIEWPGEMLTNRLLAEGCTRFENHIVEAPEN